MITLKLAVGLGVAVGLIVALLGLTVVALQDPKEAQEVTISEHFDWECIEWRAHTVATVVYSSDERPYIPEGEMHFSTAIRCAAWEDADGLPNRAKDEESK